MTKVLKRTKLHSSVYNLRVGDILQYKAKGQKKMTHSMIVTAKGSQIYLSYHTTNTRNKPLAAVLKGKSGYKWYAHKV